MSDEKNASTPPVEKTDKPSETINIKVTDSSTEVFFKIKPTTKLSKVFDAFCKRTGKSLDQLRFLLDGERVHDTQTPEDLGMVNDDIIEAHSEQIGGL